VDPRMANLFNLTFAGENPLLQYFDELKFGDRVVYWLTGWNIFNEFPILGVGLGTAGFYFSRDIPSFGWTLVEVRALMYRSTLLLNIKNLWFRLLAETGIVGFAVFIGWLISLVPEFIHKFQSNQKNKKMLGLMGFMVIAALFFEGFSIDSFAMPYWWISLGLASASYKE
jgi:O-antigen ligase